MTPPGQNPETPGTPPPPPVSPSASPGAPSVPAPATPPAAAWLEKTVAVVYCVFCIEIGLFLLIYPWMRSWEYNYLIHLKPSLAGFLTSVQCRGAVSGLGVLNLIVAVSEILALRRFSAR